MAFAILYSNVSLAVGLIVLLVGFVLSLIISIASIFVLERVCKNLKRSTIGVYAIVLLAILLFLTTAPFGFYLGVFLLPPTIVSLNKAVKLEKIPFWLKSGLISLVLSFLSILIPLLGTDLSNWQNFAYSIGPRLLIVAYWTILFAVLGKVFEKRMK